MFFILSDALCVMRCSGKKENDITDTFDYNQKQAIRHS